MAGYLQYKTNIISALKEAGYSTVRIRKEHIMGEQMLQKIRTGEMPSWKTIETLCHLLKCQPGDLIEYIEDVNQE